MSEHMHDYNQVPDTRLRNNEKRILIAAAGVTIVGLIAALIIAVTGGGNTYADATAITDKLGSAGVLDTSRCQPRGPVSPVTSEEDCATLTAWVYTNDGVVDDQFRSLEHFAAYLQTGPGFAVRGHAWLVLVVGDYANAWAIQDVIGGDVVTVDPQAGT